MSDGGFPAAPAADEPCPCGRGGALGVTAYGRCCGRYLGPRPGTGEQAPDVESLMRSRYTAYVLGRGDHVLSTWHRTTRPRALDLDPRTVWLGLTVLAHSQSDGRGEVTFEARLRDADGRDQTLRERSAFVHTPHGWQYTQALPPA